VRTGTTDKGEVLTLETFGGVPHEEWAKLKNPNKFPPRTEMRRWACPAWWYQCVDYDLKPQWKECIGCGSFRDCSCYPDKEKCWERFDKEKK
jgi:hypothetical protein